MRSVAELDIFYYLLYSYFVMEYSEPELIMPALRKLAEHPQGLTTSDLIKILERELKPTGHDARIIPGRGDSYFSQKVRNLTGSHRTLERHSLAKVKGNRYFITNEGIMHLKEDELKYNSLREQGFSKKQIRKEAKKDYAELIIEEGVSILTEALHRRRSRRLRRYAIEAYRKTNGSISCIICGFDFGKMYGGYGEGYIEMHHKVPINIVDERGVKEKLPDALKKVVPLCSNCHRMIHRKRKKLLSIEELKQLIQNNK